MVRTLIAKKGSIFTQKTSLCFRDLEIWPVLTEKIDTTCTQKASLHFQDLGIWPVAQAPASLGANRYEHPGPRQVYMFKSTSLAGCPSARRPWDQLSGTHRASNKIRLVMCTLMAEMNTIFTRITSLPFQDFGIWPVAKHPQALGPSAVNTQGLKCLNEHAHL